MLFRSLGIIDEGWAADAKRELAMRPAMMTRLSKQLWICSMVPGISRAGTMDSRFLRDKMTVGREFVESDIREGICYIEYGAHLPVGDDEDPLDYGDPDTWWSCMPALGHTITEASIRADYQSMPLVDFCAEYLSIWPKDFTPTWTVFKRQAWIDLGDGLSQPVGRVALGADIDEERDRGFVATAGKRVDGDWHIEIIEPGQDIDIDTIGVDWMADRTERIVDAHDPVAVVVSPRGPGQSLIQLLKNKGIEVMTPNTLEVSGACGRFLDATKTKPKARHLSQASLDLAVAVVRKLISPTNRTFTWDRTSGAVSALYAVTLAMHG